LSKFGKDKNIIHVSGTINITSPVDISFTNNSQVVVFQGDGAVFNITSAVGLIVGSLQEYRNIVFVYNPTGISYLNANDMINVTTSAGSSGAILATTPSHLIIEKCRFTTSLSQKPPYIHIKDGGDNIYIKDNTFGSPGNYSCAIALNNSTNTSVNYSNVWIRDNAANSHSIVMGTEYTISSTSNTFTNLIVPINVNIVNNSCGVLGYIVCDDGTQSPVNSNASTSLNINGNDAAYILSPISMRYLSYQTHVPNTASLITFTGHYLFHFNNGYLSTVASANISIEGNNSVSIWGYGNTVDGYNCGDVIISGNKLKAYDPADVGLTSFIDSKIISGGGGVSAMYPAIYFSHTGSYAGNQTQITNNIIDWGNLSSSTYSYYNGIFVYATTPGIKIAGNSVGGFVYESSGNKYSGNGIAQFGTGNVYDITGNNIRRNVGDEINSYIQAGILAAGGKISGNIFSSPYINKAANNDSVLLVGGASAKDQDIPFDISRNTNFTKISHIAGMNGIVISGASNSAVIFGAAYDVEFIIGGTNASDWIIPLSVLPQSAKIISVEADYVSLQTSTVTINSKIVMYSSNTLATDSTGPTQINTSASYKQILTPANIWTTGNNNYIDLTITVSGGSTTVNLNDLFITYRYL
jgi:hypothetical protein